MTHNNDIAYASLDFNSLTTLLFVKELVQVNMKENTKPTFCEGNQPAIGSHTLDHESSTPMIPCNGNLPVTSGFAAHRASNGINYGITNDITVT